MKIIKKLISKLLGKSRRASNVGIIGGSDGPTAVFQTSDVISTRIYRNSSKEQFHAWLDNAAKQIKPCGKTIAELENYLLEKYNAKKVEASDFHTNIIKTNIIMNFFPHLLTTPQINFDYGKKPSKKQMREFAKNSEKRHNEAKEYPLNKLNLEICVYEFPFTYENQGIGTFRATLEHTTGYSTIGFAGNCGLTDAQQKATHDIIKNIDLFKGVTKEDIDNRTPRFMSHATTLLNYKQKNDR